MNQQVVVPNSGLFVVRPVDKHYAIVGVLHFPADFVISECAAYLCVVAGGQLFVQRDPVGPRTQNDDWSGFGVDALLRSRAWSATTTPYTFTARFYLAFPESNGWVLIAASNQPVAPGLIFDSSGHAWASIQDGTLVVTGHKEVASVTGESCGGLLRSLAIWPDAQGILHSLPGIESGYRGYYTRLSTLRARVSLGEITIEEARQIVDDDEQLRRLNGRYVHDEKYGRFLAVLYKKGMIGDDRPYSRDELSQRDIIIEEAYAACESVAA